MVARAQRDRAVSEGHRMQAWEQWVRGKIEFYITTNQWDKVSFPTFRAWLDNFDADGKKYAFALLNHFIFYSARHIDHLCRHALMSVVFADHLLDADSSHGFLQDNEALRRELELRIRETHLVPVTAEGNATESGNAIARCYTATGLIQAHQVITVDQIIDHTLA